ncbi:MAG TPA: DUF2007 domain-containing protein [Gemmatimonadaceae bacterium]|jgi:hypothetical protein
MTNTWARLANYGSGLEADVVVERLRAAGIEAVARGNDIVGIFGPAFQGTTARGVDVLVFERDLRAAQSLLDDTLADDENDDGDESDESDDD